MLTTLFLCLQQDGVHRSRGGVQPGGLAVPVCRLLPLARAPLPRVELPLGHPAARGGCHLPLGLRCASGWALASDPRRYVWSLTLTHILVIRWGRDSSGSAQMEQESA